MKKTTILMTLILLLTPLNTLAEQILSTWTGNGDGLSWGDPANWNPVIVPDNDVNTYYVTINSPWVFVKVDQTYRIDQLDTYGEVNMGADSWDEILYVKDGVTNYDELNIERLVLCGTITNTTGALLELEGIDLSYGIFDINNQEGGTVVVENDETDIGGDFINSGKLIVYPFAFLNVERQLRNAGTMTILSSKCSVGEIYNLHTGTIQGSGIVSSDGVITNEGAITANRGRLMLESESSVENTGTLKCTSMSVCHVLSPSTFHNSGMIEIDSGSGFVMDPNLVNEPNGTITLGNGTLTAMQITHQGDANFVGFGGIDSDVSIDPNGTIKLTGPTNIVGDVEINANATLEISDGIIVVTGYTSCNDGTIHMKGGRLIPQGGFTNNNCIVIWEPGLYNNMADFNLDGKVNFKDFAEFADTWLWLSQL